MRRTKILILAVLLAAAAIPSTASATGFGLYEQGTQATGMNGAVIAGASDASTLFYNPAGMTQLSGVDIQLTLTGYIGLAGFTGDASGKTTNSETKFQPVPAAFVSWKATPWLAVGIGEFTNNGLGIFWPQGWENRVDCISSDLKSFTINPSIAFGPFKGFSIGVGFDVVLGTVIMKKGLNFADGSDKWMLELGGDAVGYGWNLGLMYKPIDWFSVGAVYRSQVRVNTYKANVDFTVPTAFQNDMQDQAVNTGLWLPDQFGIGVRFTPIKGLDIELDYDYYTWNLYNQVVINFQKQPKLNTVLVNNWRGAFDLRLGASYRYKDWKFAVGLGYDDTPVTSLHMSPTLPDNNRINWSVGVSYYFWKMHVDLAYLMVNVLPRSAEGSLDSNNGAYTTMVNDISLGVGFNF